MKTRYLLTHILLLGAIVTFAQEIKFETVVVSNSVALHPQIFDVNNDGKNDIVVVDNYIDTKGDDGTNIKSICWISTSDYKKHPICELNYRACDMNYADIDNDGYLDLIGRYDTDGDDMNATGSIFWLKNPYGNNNYNGEPWVKTDIGFSTYAKDIIPADFNRDGKIDIVARAVDRKLNIYLQNAPSKWEVLKIDVPEHDGTDVGDINKDGIPDIAINGMWFETTKDVKKTGWIKHDFAPEWYSQKTGKGSWFDNNTKVKIADLDNDGWPDIVVSMAENTGYQVTWYKNPGKITKELWDKYPIGYMNYCHTLQVADMDNDGDKDIVCGELIIWNSPNPEGYHPVVVFVNKGNSLEWNRQVIAEKACYGGKVSDIDNDGDMDIVAPRNWNKGPLYLWKNLTNEKFTSSDVKISETVAQGIPSLKIETPSATYLYDKAGGGFISMIDKDGKDWISFKNTESTPPMNNAASKYRGIPNLGIKGADNDAGHPGYDVCVTKVIAPNVVETTTKTGNWKFRWSFYDKYAKFTMVKTFSGVPYWFLYEGTPAGKYEPEKMYWGNNLDGRMNDFPDLLQNTGTFNNWNWVYAGQKDYPRVLFLKQLQQDENPDLFSYMGSSGLDARKSSDGMVCFGFGRAQRTKPILDEENNEFVIGFFDSEIKNADDNLTVTKYIEGIK
jgi:hypothetical protein